MTTLDHNRHELFRFLDAHRATDPKTASMTGMGDKKGKWYISDEEYPKFLDLMHNYLFVKKWAPNAFVEQPRKGKAKPLLIDLDFKYSAEKALVRTFTFEQIRSFCQMLVNGLKIFFDVEDYESLRFFVTLRPAPYSTAGSKERKDGIHILCPDISFMDDRQTVLRNWMLSQNAIETCFSGTEYANKPPGIYDQAMTHKQGWIFYGESKPNIQPYKLERIFTYTPSTDTFEEESPLSYTPRKLMALLSVRYNIVPDTTTIRDEAVELYEQMRLYGDTLRPAADTEAAIVDNVEARNTLIDAIHALYPVDLDAEEMTVIRRIVMECLSEERASNYETWIRVGWCLHNISPSEEHFQLWMDFSGRSGKSGQNDMAKLRRDWFNGWKKHDDGPRLTERSLRFWAKNDNEAAYKAVQSEYLGEYIRQELEPTHWHITKLMKKMFGANYVASVSARNTDWYNYNDTENMWKRLNQGIELRLKLCTEVADEISAAGRKYYSLSGNLTPGETKTNVEKQKELMKIQMNLYSSGFGESVMKMAIQQFYEADFQAKLNINGNLFACRNGILELRTPGPDGREHVLFRQGRPEDYMSFLAGQNHPETEPIEYHPYDATDPLQYEIADFFSKLFPDAELRRYVLRLLASCLEGFNREQCFYIATGGGGNGKSKLVELMRLTFGDYQTALQSTVLTRKRPEAGAANPEIMAAKCRRFIYLQEPDDKEPLNTSRMKQFSGEDMVEARALYGDQEKFIIMGKLVMMCNKLPPVTTMDRGTWRRIRVIEFVSKFVPPDDLDLIEKRRPNVFPMDNMLDKKLRTWREPFLALLVHIYETEYIPFGLNPVPAAVMKASDKYKNDFDTYARFRSERVRLPTTLEEKIQFRDKPMLTKDIKTIVSKWSKDVRVELNFQDVINRFTEEFGEPANNGKEWPAICVFAGDDLVVDWDMAHAANTS